MYSGLRTSFALSPEQTRGNVRHGAELKGYRLRLSLDLARETVGGPLSLSFWPIADGARRAEDDAASLRYALNTLLDAARFGKRTEIAGQWPPLEIGPGAPAPTELRRRALARVGGWTALAAWLGASASFGNPGVGLTVFLVVAVGANLAIRADNRPRWKAYRDARKVWREP